MGYQGRDDGPEVGEAAPVGPFKEILERSMEDLRIVAAAIMRGERLDHTLQATSVLHEVWIRAAEQGWSAPEEPREFFRFAVQEVRRILVDHARHRVAQKRGGGRIARLTEVPQSTAPEAHLTPAELLEVDEAIGALRAFDHEAARLVELRFFAGLGTEQCADMLGVSIRTAHNRWALARAFLKDRLGDAPAS